MRVGFVVRRLGDLDRGSTFERNDEVLGGAVRIGRVDDLEVHALGLDSEGLDTGERFNCSHLFVVIEELLGVGACFDGRALKVGEARGSRNQGVGPGKLGRRDDGDEGAGVALGRFDRDGGRARDVNDGVRCACVPADAEGVILEVSQCAGHDAAGRLEGVS